MRDKYLKCKKDGTFQNPYDCISCEEKAKCTRYYETVLIPFYE